MQVNALRASLHGRAPVVLGLLGIATLSWAWLLPAALDMYGDMDGLSAWMMSARWDARYLVLIFLMWAVMMVGMMLPSAMPAILIYREVVQSQARPQAPLLRTYAFSGGYLGAWIVFSAAATLLQWALAEASLLSPMMESTRPWFAGGLLIAAGIYQWTPLKQSCLVRCRSPMDYLSRRWRPGAGGAFAMGLGHGAYCVGCCWMLMLLLFAGGVMSLACIALIAGFVLIEKLAPAGVAIGRWTGAGLIGLGLWML